MSVANNTKLGRYEIRSKIGEGGMGEVYLARDMQLDRMVALKLLSSEVARDQQRLYRFLQEARAASKLKSANVAHIYEIGEIDGHHFIAMEHVEGQPLNREIAGQPKDPAAIVRLGIQIARALEEAHLKGITHRDIKPQNIIVTPDAEVKVLDFGLAKLSTDGLNPAELSPDSQLATKVKTSPGVVMGTVNYMSPEQAMGRDVDPRTDIFSLGAVLYEMATGRVPFNGASLTETIDRIAHAQPEAIARFNYRVPAELEVIIKKALRKNRDERYQSARDMLVDLRDLERELEFASRLEHSVAPSLSESTPSGHSEQATEILTSHQRSLITSETPASPTQVSSAEYLTKEIGRHKKGVFVALAALAVAAAAVAYGLYHSFGQKGSGLQSIKIVQLTNNGKVRETASISPDGKYVAYSAVDEAAQSSIWIRHVATTSNVQIVPPAGTDVELSAPVFSPDGNYVYYLRRERSALGVLYEVPVLGGTSKKLLDGVNNPISFSPDGHRFAFSRRYTNLGEDVVMLANADGTGEQKLATVKHPDYLTGGLAWSPDGKTIACPMGGFTGGYYRSVAVFQVADGTQKLMTPHRWSNVEKVAWLADMSGVIVTAQEQAAAPFQLWQVSYPEGEARQITNDLNSYRNATLTADSDTIVTVVFDVTSNITVTPNGGWNEVLQITSGKSNGGAEDRVAWTPNGRVVYSSRANGNPDIWIMDADGRNRKQLTDDAEYERAFSMTPDGHHIVFDSDRSGTLQIWRIDIDGGNLKQITNGAGAFQPSCSPDGKWVAYTTFGSGGFNIWKSPIDGGEPVQVTSKVSRLPSVSPDGKLIGCYYTDEQSHAEKIALVPFDGGEPVKMFDIPQTSIRAQALRWTPDGRALTYIVSRGVLSNIWAQPVEGGEPKQLTDFKNGRIFSFDWSRDGKWLACSHGTIESDVVLIKDFK